VRTDQTADDLIETRRRQPTAAASGIGVCNPCVNVIEARLTWEGRQ
jgi:hypothetical protein